MVSKRLRAFRQRGWQTAANCWCIGGRRRAKRERGGANNGRVARADGRGVFFCLCVRHAGNRTEGKRTFVRATLKT